MWLAFKPILTWIFSTAVIKGVFLTIITALITLLFSLLWDFWPDWATPDFIKNSLNTIPSGMWWFLDLTNISFGMPLVMSALFTRFIIRRLPFIG